MDAAANKYWQDQHQQVWIWHVQFHSKQGSLWIANHRASHTHLQSNYSNKSLAAQPTATGNTKMLPQQEHPVHWLDNNWAGSSNRQTLPNTARLWNLLLDIVVPASCCHAVILNYVILRKIQGAFYSVKTWILRTSGHHDPANQETPHWLWHSIQTDGGSMQSKAAQMEEHHSGQFCKMALVM